MNEKYTLIYADPPWTYRDKAKDGELCTGNAPPCDQTIVQLTGVVNG